MGQPRAEIVALVLDEDLRLVLQAAEGLAVHDPVAVALEDGAQRVLGFVEAADTRAATGGGPRAAIEQPSGWSSGDVPSPPLMMDGFVGCAAFGRQFGVVRFRICFSQ